MTDSETPDVTIHIYANPGTEEAIVSNPGPHVPSGGTVDWECEHGPWVVLFEDKGNGPFADDDRGRRAHDGKPRTVKDHLVKPHLRYRYNVSFYHEQERKVYTSDPEVIIDPRDRGE